MHVELRAGERCISPLIDMSEVGTRNDANHHEYYLLTVLLSLD